MARLRFVPQLLGIETVAERDTGMQSDSGVGLSRTNGSRKPFLLVCLRVAALLCVLTIAAVYEAAHVSAFFEDSMWGHLSTGVWIADNHAVPRTGLFSQFSDVRWVDSSWGFDLVCGLAYQLLGLRAIPVLLMWLKVGVAAVTFCLATRGGRHFWPAVPLSAAGQYAITGVHAGPVWFSMVFFGIELWLLRECRRSGDMRRLFFLPPLFLLWANLHIQFFAGLLLLGVFLLALPAEGLLRRTSIACLNWRPAPPLTNVAVVAALSLLATFLTPYSMHLFTHLKDDYSAALFRYSPEMHPLTFRQPQHYVMLLLVMWAFFALGRQRSRDVFKLALLLAGTLIAFRIQRDLWIAVFIALPVLGDALYAGDSAFEKEETCSRWESAVVTAVTFIVLVIAARFVPRNDKVIQMLSNVLPVKACDFIRTTRPPGPLFNPYAWGGFLSWYLREYPVSIDERVGLYGDQVIKQHHETVSGKQLLELDPSFANAGTILLERQSGMARALTTIPILAARYHVLYGDKVALVVQRK